MPGLIRLLASAGLLAYAIAPATPLGAQVTGATAREDAPTMSRAGAAGRELTADQQVAHVLHRLAFGPRPGDIQKVREMGVDRWIEQQLRPDRIRDDATQRFVAGYQFLQRDPAELLDATLSPAERARVQQQRSRAPGDTAMMAEPPIDTAAMRRAREVAQRSIGELQSAKVARAVMSERQLEEVLVDFWENHFSVFAGKGPTRYYLPEYTREAIRPHVLGSFREMLGAVAKSPAMLFYLDNWQSAADSGRPTLVEMPQRRGLNARRRPGQPARPGQRTPPAGLDSMRFRPQVGQQPGRRRPGLNENYARELLELHTLGVDGGYTQQDVIEVARAFTGWSIEDPRRSGEFVFRGIMHDAGEKTVLGTRLPAGRGIEDGEQVLDLVARHPSTARHIAHKLATRFVSDSPPEALVERAAETFRRTDGDLREVVRTIVTSDEFFSRAAYRTKVKSPFELVTSALRAIGAEPDRTPRTAQIVARLGQPLYLHEAPNGWPETGGEWINTGAILNRINFGMQVAAGRVPGVNARSFPLAQELRTATREAQVDGVIRALFNGEVSPDTRSILTSGQNPLGREDPEMPMARVQGFAQVLGLALGAPEFQRR